MYTNGLGIGIMYTALKATILLLSLVIAVLCSLEELLLQPVFKNYSTRITVQRIIYRIDVTEYQIRDEVSTVMLVYIRPPHI
jgi:hypothetical protein